MPDIYAFDLAATTGWARCVDGRVTSGVERFVGPRVVRLGRFREWLWRVLPPAILPGAIVAYERPHLRGYDATLSLVGYVLTLEERAYAIGAKLLGVHTGTLKKHATGFGKASKEAMVGAARNRWPGFDPATDDEADARHVLTWAADQCGAVLPCE